VLTFLTFTIFKKMECLLDGVFFEIQTPFFSEKAKARMKAPVRINLAGSPAVPALDDALLITSSVIIMLPFLEAL
jgi:hypothetical protein